MESLIPPAEIIPELLIIIATSIGVFLLLERLGADNAPKYRWGDAPRRQPKYPILEIVTPHGLVTFFAFIIIAGALGAFGAPQ